MSDLELKTSLKTGVIVILLLTLLIVHPGLVSLSIASTLIEDEFPEPEATEEPLSEDFSSFAQAYFLADTYTPLVGEPIQLTLVVQSEPGVEIAEWPELPETWRVFMVREAGEISVNERSDGSTEKRQTFTIYVWRPGDFETPDVFIGYELLATSEFFRIPVRSVFFTVPTVLETGDLNQLTIRPYLPPVGFFYLPPWMLVIIGGGVVGAAWGLRRYLERRRLRRLAEQIQIDPVTPAEFAQADLIALKQGALSSSSPPPAVCIAVADVVRKFIQDAFTYAALDMTTSELLDEMRRSEVHTFSDELLERLDDILSQADLVKFANLQPDKDFTVCLVEMGQQWVVAADGLIVSDVVAQGDD